MRRLALLLAAVLVMAFIPSTASAGKPDKPGKPNGPPYYAPTTCAMVDDPYGFWGSPDDGLLLLQGIGDCNDVSGLENGSTFVFGFLSRAATSPSKKGRPVSVRLGVRNSLGGEWCDGDWSVDGGTPIVAEYLTVDPAAVGTVTLQVTEELDHNGNCANRKGQVRIFDDDDGHVVTAWTTGKELDGSVTVSLAGPISAVE